MQSRTESIPSYVASHELKARLVFIRKMKIVSVLLLKTNFHKKVVYFCHL